MQQARKPNLIWRLLKGGWDTLNFGRRLILNVVFVLLILLFIGAASDQQTPMQTRTTLIIAPEAVVVEQYSADAVQRMIGKFAGGIFVYAIAIYDAYKTARIRTEVWRHRDRQQQATQGVAPE